MAADIYDKRFLVENTFKLDDKELPEKDNKDKSSKPNYWLSPNRAPASFVLNLGCRVTMTGVNIINTHNRWAKDRSSRRFK